MPQHTTASGLGFLGFRFFGEGLGFKGLRVWGFFGFKL